MALARPIIYVRGYAGTQSAVEDTVDDPTYGFNAGSTHIRLMENGKADMFMFVSPFARLQGPQLSGRDRRRRSKAPARFGSA